MKGCKSADYAAFCTEASSIDQKSTVLSLARGLVNHLEIHLHIVTHF